MVGHCGTGVGQARTPLAGDDEAEALVQRLGARVGDGHVERGDRDPLRPTLVQQMLDQRPTGALAARLWPNPEVGEHEASARRRRDDRLDTQGPPDHARSCYRPVAAEDLAGSRDHEAKSHPAAPTGTGRDDRAVDLAHDVVSPSELARAVEERPPEEVLGRRSEEHTSELQSLAYL